MAVTISLHSCTSSKKISVLPGTSFSPPAQRAAAGNRCCRWLFQTAAARLCFPKIQFHKIREGFLSQLADQVVLPTCRAPVTSSALRASPSKNACIFLAVVRCKIVFRFASMSDASIRKNILSVFQMYYTALCPFTQHICLLFCPVFRL